MAIIISIFQFTLSFLVGVLIWYTFIKGRVHSTRYLDNLTLSLPSLSGSALFRPGKKGQPSCVSTARLGGVTPSSPAERGQRSCAKLVFIFLIAYGFIFYLSVITHDYVLLYINNNPLFLETFDLNNFIGWLSKEIEYAKNVSITAFKKLNGSAVVDIFNDVKKSNIRSAHSILENFSAKFETLDGISKLAFILTFSSSMISWSLIGILFNLYGDYLLNRFKLEERFPKLAKIIIYRKKLTKYYIISNSLFIFSLCLMNIFLGLFVLSLYI